MYRLPKTDDLQNNEAILKAKATAAFFRGDFLTKALLSVGFFRGDVLGVVSFEGVLGLTI